MSKTGGRRKFFSGCVCCEPASFAAGPDLSRRSFLAGSAAALGLGAAGAAISPARVQAQAKPSRIDVHHHIVPPMQRQANIARRGGSGGPKWSVQMSLDDMDKGGVAKSITSILNPGPWYGKIDEESRKLARECNEYAAKLRSDHPTRFGLFAAIAPPDVEGSLREIAYAMDTLKADGIALWTSYDGKYLGDESFVPVFEELNRRKAVVYTHPTTAACCGKVVDGIPPSAIEYATDTTRTVGSLIFGKAGTAFKFPDIKWIWSHSGGTIPFLTSRFERLAFERKMPNGPMPVLQKHYYEIAQGNTQSQLAALMKMVNISQVMFGSDYPFREAKEAVDGELAYKFSEADMRAIDYENAVRIMPQLKA